MVNKGEITGGNSFNENYFEVEGKHKSTKDVLGTFADLRPVLCDLTAKYAYLRSSSIVWFLKFLSHFQ